MRKVRIAPLIGFILVSYIGLSIYVIAKQGTEELLLCVDNGGVKIPFSKYLCREYLFNVRGSQQDIDTLHRGIGASFVIQGKSTPPEREQVLKYLITKGLDVNHIDMHQLSPLHGAALANSVDEVEMLLRNGANTDLKDKKFGLTPLELALKLQSEDKLQSDRQAVISLLKNAK